MKNSDTIFDGLIDILNEIVRYAEKQSFYEVQQKIQHVKKQLKHTEYLKNSSAFHNVTKDFNITKFKYDRLKKKVESLPSDRQSVIKQFITDIEERIDGLKSERDILS